MITTVDPSKVSLLSTLVPSSPCTSVSLNTSTDSSTQQSANISVDCNITSNWESLGHGNNDRDLSMFDFALSVHGRQFYSVHGYFVLSACIFATAM